MSRNNPTTAIAAAPAADTTVEVTIHRGTYQPTADEEYGPGSTVTVSAREAARLKALGVVKPDDYVEPEEAQDGTLRLTSDGGATVTS